MNTSIRNKNKNCVIPAKAGIQAGVAHLPLIIGGVPSHRGEGVSLDTVIQRYDTNNGFTLIETLVAISIFVASVTALLVVTGDGIKNTNSAQNRLTATYLAQEGAELIRAARDSYFLEQAYYKTVNPLVPEPDMNRITRFCNTKKGIGTLPYEFCRAINISLGNSTPWAYNPTVAMNPNTNFDRLAGPLGPCKRTTGNAVSDEGLAGSVQGCNINFQLQTRVCTEQMHLAQWEDVDSMSGIFGTIPDKRAKFGAEKCAEYFYDQGIFRPSFMLSYIGDQIVVDDLDDDITRSGFVRQIFVEPETASLDLLTDTDYLSDPFGPKGGLRVTVRVYWIEGHRLLNVRVDDFLTAWPGKIVQGTTTP